MQPSAAAALYFFYQITFMVCKKRRLLLQACFVLLINFSFAQEQKIADSLAIVYQQNQLTGTAKFELLRDLSFNELKDLKKGLRYAQELIRLAEQTNNSSFLRVGYFLLGTKKRMLGQLDEALAAYFKSAEIARKTQNLKAEAESYSAIADTYITANNPANASEYYKKAIVVLQQVRQQSKDDSITLASVFSNAGDAFRLTGNADSAFFYLNTAKAIFDKVNYPSGKAYSLGNIGMVHASTGNKKLAEKYINEAIQMLEKNQDYYPICVYLVSMADVYLDKGDTATAVAYTARSLHLAEQYGLKEQIRDASLKLSELSEHTGKTADAFRHYKRYVAYRDSINNLMSERNMANQRYNYEMSQKQIEVNALNRQRDSEKKLTILLGIILGLAIIIAAVLSKNNQNKQKAYKILTAQKHETDRQRSKAEEALNELQLTQKQLIQSAKMASLGELTAGIAHEIQNPLNFVNNFSELSCEMLGELKDATADKLTGSDKAKADDIIGELAGNLKKICEHGKRADSIVKGMLQHSRTSEGKKEPTDINALVDEYLRLSYHGLRAKDKAFCATFKTQFDQAIGTVEIIPQEIGRVLLNVFNNAFYAVNEKSKQGNSDFKPLVTVITRKVENNALISVTDNGIGIPHKLLDKIFQPFFTTKPAGQGTGLGLSLSYDIIKAHGGEFKVETTEGESTEFLIQLPLGNNNHKTISKAPAVDMK
ncbi:ATP-binding protein [Flavisolibacter nicotianae]|uniref:ATP-binding protein n=1 Tax=Flavisolibacter nicotianae TaxID=2364882 RepID=UPI000EB5BFE4|nr:ATP-binding protein [Flavisolibacter nicotianae]